jgi:histone acetyltransferase MYST1
MGDATPHRAFAAIDARAMFALGARVRVRATTGDAARDGVVAARKGDGPRASDVKYYVRYDADDAPDEWVRVERMTRAVGDSAGGSETTGGGSRSDAATAARREAKKRDAATRDEGVAANDSAARKVRWIEIGRYICDAWFDSPFPEEYADERRLFVCDFCLKYHRKRRAYIAHKKTCELRHPPGNEIYRHPERRATATTAARAQLRMWEVDGSNATTYCQNLCLVSKLFLHHKTLYYDVAAFYFYVLTERDFDARGEACYRIIGYFSKEKGQVETNLACILTLPPYQRRGYGAFLIEFSYELSKREGRIGTPERPLSDLGFKSYRAYWSRVIYEHIKERDDDEVNVAELSKRTNIRVDDIVSTLQPFSSIRFFKDRGFLKITKEGKADFEAAQVKIGDETTELYVIPERLQFEPKISAVVEVTEQRRRTRLFRRDAVDKN